MSAEMTYLCHSAVAGTPCCAWADRSVSTAVNQSLIGTVYLVGAGPGDPELLTVKAHRLLQSCDAVVYDSLVPEEVLDLVPTSASASSSENVEATIPCRNRYQCCPRRAGQTSSSCCPTEGGDPFLFGRGGEEAAHLASHGIPVEVVPGVTSGIAAPAYAGIPVTHRRAGSSVTFVTGHEEIDKRRPSVDWRALASASDGLVIYMGLHNLPRIAEELMAGGLSSQTPAAVIQQGTVEGQRCLKAPLSDIASMAVDQGFRSPSIVLIGEVINHEVPSCAPRPAAVTMPIPF